MSQGKLRYYEFGEYRLDAYERQLLKAGQVVPLTHKVFELLLMLVENGGRIVEKEELMQRVWPDAIVEESNLKNSISALRKALGDAAQESRYIQTLPKRGYRLVAEVVALPDEDEALVIKRHTFAEIVIDEVVEDHRQVDDEALPKAITSVVDLSGEDRSNALAPVPSAPIGSARAGSIIAWAKRHKGLLLLAAFLLAVGGVVWFGWLAPAGPKLNFDHLRVTKLSKPGNSPAFLSPDGKYLAYLSDVGLWVKPVDADAGLQLMPSLPDTFWALAFSKDSSRIYLTVGGDTYPRGALYQLPLLGGPSKRILESIGSAVAFSPDGKRMAIFDPAKGLVTANLDGSDVRTVFQTEGKYHFVSYSWSPDGKRFALVGLDAADQQTWKLFEVPAEGGEAKPIGKALGLRQIGFLTWFPDGKGLLLVGMDGPTGLRQLWYVSYPDGELRRITHDPNDYWHASLTDDGNSIFAYYPQEASNIWLAAIDDLEHAKKIATRNGSFEDARWAPDGRILFSTSEVGLWGKRDIWVMNADGSHQERLTEAGSNRSPAMSPDGRLIAFRSIRDKDIRQLWLMEADGRNPRQLVTGHESKFPGFTADGKWIVYVGVTGQGENLFKIPVEGGEPVPLTTNKVITSWVFSPDGKRVAYNFYDEQKKRRVIGVKPVAGGEPEQIYDYLPDLQFGRDQHWSKGKFVLQQWTKDGFLCLGKEIYLLPLDGSKPRQLSHFNSSDAIYASEISPDGKQMVFSRGALTFDAVLFTDFR